MTETNALPVPGTDARPILVRSLVTIPVLGCLLGALYGSLVAAVLVDEGGGSAAAGLALVLAFGAAAGVLAAVAAWGAALGTDGLADRARWVLMATAALPPALLAGLGTLCCSPWILAGGRRGDAPGL